MENESDEEKGVASATPIFASPKLFFGFGAIEAFVSASYARTSTTADVLYLDDNAFVSPADALAAWQEKSR